MKLLLRRLDKNKTDYIYNEDLEDEQSFDIGNLFGWIPI